MISINDTTEIGFMEGMGTMQSTYLVRVCIHVRTTHYIGNLAIFIVLLQVRAHLCKVICNNA